MIHWAAIFLVLALLAAVFAFGGIAKSSAGVATVLFFVFVGLFVLSLALRAWRGK
ncbi:uncharacterized protein DUF1328 [Litoreibacter ponti]|uniref:UPF0391 membrane protein C8N43_0788 n=1 Tax=Litoreibacter ponti TaxID=1510457 RepID=A0A2T6BJ98_9RHOB|nr:DUF1328 domain-containing protein [Litoreibacter ponti]PTX56137.1 uncharacterized protein DUF1328 [Litoreibacter ponti]